MINRPPSHVSRKPQWRWELAGDLLAAKRYARGSDDELVALAHRFRAAAAGVRTDQDLRVLRHQWPELFAARELYQSRGVVRDEVDARVLSGQGVEEIAALTGVASSIIGIYEHLFWDVRWAVAQSAQGWLTTALGVWSWTAGSMQERQVWLYLALGHRRDMLDVVIADHLGRTEPILDNRHRLAEGMRLAAREFALPQSPRSEAIKLVEAVTPFRLEMMDRAETPQEYQRLKRDLIAYRRSYGLSGLPR